ncbi:MAG: FAD-binding protein [Coriobacteriaceae bacterium]
METDIPEEKILETVDCDVCVVGLGVAGVGALRSAAEGGLKVVGVEKGSKPSARSNMFAAFGTEKTRSIGIEDISPTEVANELMTQMSHRADYRITTKWLKNCGEAFEWYTSAYDGLLWLGMEDELPEILVSCSSAPIRSRAASTVSESTTSASSPDAAASAAATRPIRPFCRLMWMRLWPRATRKCSSTLRL